MPAEPQSVNDRERIEAAQRDPALFAALYDDHFYRVYAYVVRRVQDRHVAEDLTSQVFHEALANLKKFEWRGVPFLAWLLKIAANAVHDHWSRRAKETGLPAPADEGEHPHTERQAALYQLIERLPDAQRRVIEMRFVEQKSIKEAAEELGRTEGAIKQLQLRALETLREAWEGVR
jgi:RNA polymerase sigma-70 factor (ECF subfamily)